MARKMSSALQPANHNHAVKRVVAAICACSGLTAPVWATESAVTLERSSSKVASAELVDGPSFGPSLLLRSAIEDAVSVLPASAPSGGVYPGGVYPQASCPSSPTRPAPAGYHGVYYPPESYDSGAGYDSGTCEYIMAGVYMASGVAMVSTVDLSLPTDGPSVVVSRSYAGAQMSATNATCSSGVSNEIGTGPVLHNSQGPQGTNWFQNSRPEISFAANASSDTMYVLTGGHTAAMFVRVESPFTDPSDSGYTVTRYRGVNGNTSVAVHRKPTSGGGGLVTVYDQAGTISVFYDHSWYPSGGSSTKKVNGQLWKVTASDGQGNSLYVGDESSATLALAGFDVSGGASTVYDGSGRRWTYGFTTINSIPRIETVVAAIPDGEGWKTVASVAYEYYESDVAGQGLIGDLKTATSSYPIEISSSQTGTIDSTHYYRYYTHDTEDAQYDEFDNPLPMVGQIKMVIEPEGYRKLTVASIDPDLATDAQIDEYASYYYKGYDSKNRVTEAVFNGGCGCSGTSGEGAYSFSYSVNGSYATTKLGDSNYDNSGDWAQSSAKWSYATTVTDPESRQTMTFFDELHQPLGRVLSSASESPFDTSEALVQVKMMRRDSSARISEVYPPLAVSAYSHISGATGPIVTLKTDSSFAMRKREYSQIEGLNYAVTKMSTYIGGYEYVDTEVNFAATSSTGTMNDGGYRAVGITPTAGSALALSRPVVASVVTHLDHGSTGTSTRSVQTDYSYTFYSESSTTSWRTKSVTKSSPAVLTAQNGANFATSTVSYYDQKGRTVFTVDQVGRYAYTEYDASGNISKAVDDPKNGGAANSATSVFSISLPSDGFEIQTTYTYDNQGRTSTITTPAPSVGGASARVAAMHYTKLADGRPVTIAIPLTSGFTSSTGPCQYTVKSLSGQSEFSATLVLGTNLSGGSTNSTDYRNWIDSAKSDPIEAVIGSGCSLTHAAQNLYNESGTKLVESRVFFSIPSSIPSSGSSSPWDRMVYAYDIMGRVSSVLDSTETETVTQYDLLGRPARSSTGVTTQVDTSFTEHDGGIEIGVAGDSRPTARYAFVSSSGSEDRVTSFVYDARGRAVVQLNPDGPHVVRKYDSAGRVLAVATYANSSSPSLSTDPTASSDSDRRSLTETAYDDRGQVYQTKRWEIDQSDGDKEGYLTTDIWYDAAGRTIKSRGSSLSKTQYDRLGRAVRRFVLAADDDAGAYSAASTVTGDIVTQESQTRYDAKVNRVLSRVIIARHIGDITTTGPLDTDSDLSLVDYSGGKIKGRAQITEMYYDNLDRVVVTAAHGTNNLSNYDRDAITTTPSGSATILVSTTVYNGDGTVRKSIDPKGLITDVTYDDARRQTKVVRNYVDGTPGNSGSDDGSDQTVLYSYVDGLMTAMTADLPSGTDQTTTYTYGVDTTKGSTLESNRLLYSVQYPDSAGGTDLVKFGYNRLGQQIKVTDQAGNVIETDYDYAGREITRRATTIQSGFDSYVQRIEMAYSERGQVATVTQRGGTSGSSTVRDQVAYDYDGWGNVTTFTQDVDSLIDGLNSQTGSGRDEFILTNTYELGGVNPSTGAPYGDVPSMNRELTASYAGRTIANVYNGAIEDALSRVSDVTVQIGSGSAVTVATYGYLGAGQLVHTALGQPDLTNTVVDTSGATPTYPGLDRFGRIIQNIWTRTTGAGTANVYDLELSYDENSNITWTKDNVIKRTDNNKHYFDQLYTMDGLNRVTENGQGEVDSSGSSPVINSGDKRRAETWLYSQTGNWKERKIDSNGDGDWSDTEDESETGSFNLANEISSRSITPGGGSAATVSPVYDAVGNMTNDGKRFKYVYDVFGRLVTLKKRSDDSVVAEYKYNGLNFRTGFKYGPATGTSTQKMQYWHQYDERWRPIATYRESDSNAKEAFVYHNAGIGGRGGSSYIDSVILRDRDNTTGNLLVSSGPPTMYVSHYFAGASDGTLEQRHFYCQNWRADVVVLTDSNGQPAEHVRYTAYGEARSYRNGDMDLDGAITSADYEAWENWLDEETGYTLLPMDANFDGALNPDDRGYMASLEESFPAGVDLGGVGYVSHFNNRIGYAGYQFDYAAAYNGGDERGGMYHVRHRVYVPESGRWTRRDPLGYHDGMGLYEYVQGQSVIRLDPSGLTDECPEPFSMPPENAEDNHCAKELKACHNRVWEEFADQDGWPRKKLPGTREPNDFDPNVELPWDWLQKRKKALVDYQYLKCMPPYLECEKELDRRKRQRAPSIDDVRNLWPVFKLIVERELDCYRQKLPTIQFPGLGPPVSRPIAPIVIPPFPSLKFPRIWFPIPRMPVFIPPGLFPEERLPFGPPNDLYVRIHGSEKEFIFA
jgi:RHS repeat-associated protein